MDKLVAFGVSLLEWMFFLGLIGSAIVILLTTVEDLELLVERDTETKGSSESAE